MSKSLRPNFPKFWGCWEWLGCKEIYMVDRSIYKSLHLIDPELPDILASHILGTSLAWALTSSMTLTWLASLHPKVKVNLGTSLARSLTSCATRTRPVSLHPKVKVNLGTSLARSLTSCVTRTGPVSLHPAGRPLRLGQVRFIPLG